MRKMVLIVLMTLLTASLLAGCENDNANDEKDPISLEIDSISRIDVANGTSGDFILLEKKETYEAILNILRESKFVPKGEVEDNDGWIIGIRIYSGNTHYWFMPDGINEYYYENPDLFKELLQIILEEKEVDFAREYLN